MIRTRKNEFLGFGKKKAKTDEVSAKDLKPLLAREVVFGKKAYKLDALYMKDNTLTVHFETEIYANKKPVKIEAIFTIDFNGNLDDNNLIIYKEQSVYPKGAIHRNYELKPKKEIHNKHYNNLTDAADDCNEIIESNIDTLLKNIVKDGYKLNVGESLRHERPIREAEDEDGVIVKIGNKWRIRGKKVKYWDAEYDTKADAQAALRAYWANKGESFRRSLRKIRNAKLEKKNVKEMAGNIDTKSRDGVSLYLPYTSRDVELIIGGGDLGSFHVDANIDGKESLRKAVDKVIKKAAHNLNPDERDAIESALEKHLSRMRESNVSRLKKMSNKRIITESTEQLMLKPIAKLAYKHKGEDLKSFEDFLLNKPLGLTEEEAALAIALKAKIDGEKRVDAWDTVFHLIKDRDAYKRILNSYYTRPSSFETKNDLIQDAFYMYWHDNLTMLLRALMNADTPEHEYALAIMLPDAEIKSNGDIESEMWERRKKAKNRSSMKIENKLITKKKFEATSPLRAGDVMLTYTGSVIDFDEMKEDVLSLLGLKDTSKLVLRVADESISSDEDEEMILATGDEALEKFYDTCLMVFEQGNPDVAVYLSRFDEITNFYEKLCLK